MPEHRHCLAQAQFRKAAPGDQLLRLDEEFDLANAAATELDIVAQHRDFAMALVRMDLPLDRMDVGDCREIQVFAPDIGLQFLEKGITRLKIPGNGPRLDHGGAFPVLAAAFVIVQRRFNRDGERRRAGIGPKPQIGAENVAVFGAVVQDANETSGEARKQFRRVHRIDNRRGIRIEENDKVDIGGKVELVRAELAHSKDNPP